MKIKLGYMTVSNRVMKDGEPVRYLYREKPDDTIDSGWRIFSGDETQEYADDAKNFAMYNASEVLDREPSLKNIIGAAYPVTFQRDDETGEFVEIERCPPN
jgi:hypothetical protein